jgi:putative glycosyltransferase (TIGR04372 family)
LILFFLIFQPERQKSEIHEKVLETGRGSCWFEPNYNGKLKDKVSVISKLPKIVYCSIGIGIQAFIIHTYLLKAKKENRKIILINLLNLRNFLSFGNLKRRNNNAIFNINSKYIYFKDRSILRLLVNMIFNTCYLIVFMTILPINTISKKVFKSSFRIKDAFLWLNTDYNKAYIPEKQKEFNLAKCELPKWDEVKNSDLDISFNESKNNKAKNQLIELGVPDGAWYVCVHVRGEKFYGENENNEVGNSTRNASIDNYFECFKVINAAGGYIIRLGDPCMEPLNYKTSMIIDYAHSPIRNDFLDLYLIKNCRFYIGTLSGPVEVARLFNKSIAITNIYHSSHWYPESEKCLGIMKKLKYEGKQLSIKETFNLYLTFDPIDFFDWGKLNPDLEYIENSPEEIKDLVLEMLEKINVKKYSLSSLQLEFNSFQIAIDKCIVKKKWTSASTSRNQWAVWKLSGKGSLGNSFLEKYWN